MDIRNLVDFKRRIGQLSRHELAALAAAYWDLRIHYTAQEFDALCLEIKGRS